MPSSPPTVFVPPSEEDPPSAAGAVYTAPSAGSPPGAPGAVFEVPGSEISDAILRVTGSLTSNGSLAAVPPDLLQTMGASWSSNAEENPSPGITYWRLVYPDAEWALEYYVNSILQAKWESNTGSEDTPPYDESYTFAGVSTATGTPLIRRLSGPAGPPVIFVP